MFDGLETFILLLKHFLMNILKYLTNRKNKIKCPDNNKNNTSNIKSIPNLIVKEQLSSSPHK